MNIGGLSEYSSMPRCGNSQSPESTICLRDEREARLVRRPRIAQARARAPSTKASAPKAIQNWRWRVSVSIGEAAV